MQGEKSVAQAVEELVAAEPAIAAEESEEDAPVTSEDSGAVEELLEEAEGDDPEAAEEDQEESEPLYLAVVDGKEEEVPVSKLVSSYQIQKHLDNKLQKANIDRATLEQDRLKTEQAQQAAIQDRQRYVEGLQVIQTALEQQNQDPDPRLMDENPAQYLQIQAENQKRREQIQKLETERQKEIARAREEFEANQQKFIQGHATKLMDAVPDWQDPNNRQRDLSEIEKTAQSAYGFTQQELSQVFDSRIILALRDAHKYRELMATGKQVAARKTKNAAPVIKSAQSVKVKPKTEADKAKADFKQGIKKHAHNSRLQIDDAAEFLLRRRGL